MTSKYQSTLLRTRREVLRASMLATVIAAGTRAEARALSTSSPVPT